MINASGNSIEESVAECRAQVAKEFMNLIVFEPATPSTIEQAAHQCGFSGQYSKILFPGGVLELVRLVIDISIEKVIETYPSHELANLKVRERIFTLVQAHLQLLHSQRRAWQKLSAIPALTHICESSKTLWHIADTMWYHAGDNSTDFNHYTKRLLLSKVYLSTFRFWLNDESADNESTWSYLSGQIESVMKIGKIKQFPKKIASKIPFVRLWL